MNEDIFKKAFENVKPSEELVKSVLDVRNVPAEAKKTRRFSCKRILCIAAAVCGVLVCGITTAAVTGVINFKELFGKHIDLDNDELGSKLMAQATDVVYTVSDDDYRVGLKGITGDIGSLYAIIEITRVDGTPVTEHFLNTLNDMANAKWLYDYCDASQCSGGYGGFINNKGNLEFFLDIQ